MQKSLVFLLIMTGSIMAKAITFEAQPSSQAYLQALNNILVSNAELLPLSLRRYLSKPQYIEFSVDEEADPRYIKKGACSFSNGVSIQDIRVNRPEKHLVIELSNWARSSVTEVLACAAPKDFEEINVKVLQGLIQIADLATAYEVFTGFVDESTQKPIIPETVFSSSPSYRSMAFADSEGKIYGLSRSRLIKGHVSDFIDHFSVYLSQYILDPNFKCKLPVFADYFNRYVYGNQNSTPACAIYPFVFMTSGTEAIRSEIDPNLVYRVEYLVASKGKSLISGFGHSMFRIVTCNPARMDENGNVYVGPKCLNDHNFHIVVSFRADTGNDLIPSVVGGITGEYPSKLFLLPFNNEKIEYNLEEFRSLEAYPLALTKDEQLHFIRRAQELYWSYQGNYKFISNNCAVESANFLNSILWDHPKVRLNSITPYGVLDEIIGAGLTNKNQAILLVDYEKDFSLYLDRIQNVVGGKPLKLDDFFAMPVEARARVYNNLVYLFQKSVNESEKRYAVQVLNGAIRLEEAARAKDYKKVVRQLEFDLRKKILPSSLNQDLLLFSNLMSPFSLSSSPYGIPVLHEVNLDRSKEEESLYIQNLKSAFQKGEDAKAKFINFHPDLKLEKEIYLKNLELLNKTEKTMRASLL